MRTSRMRAAGTLLCFVTLLGTLVAWGPGVDARNVSGTNGADVLYGANRADRIKGFGGDDILFGKGGADRLVGHGGDDLLFGGGGKDRLEAGDGNDVIYDDDSRSGDALLGGNGNDLLFSIDGGADKVACGGGNDVAVVDRRADTVRGCERVIRRAGRFSDGRLVLGSNRSDQFDFNDRDIDTDETIAARNGNDNMQSGDGDDTLLGGGGSDGFFGGNDDDLIIDDDSGGTDSVIPGEGSDVVYAADGVRTAIDCSNGDDDGDNDIVFVDQGDGVIDCGHVFRG
jgi:Ca2+-binding RTX toxin-like protein